MTAAYSSLRTSDSKLLYKEKLTEARIINRPNRYIAYVELADGSVVKAHVPVGGRIGGLTVDNLSCLISGPYVGRSTDYTVEAIGLRDTATSCPRWIGINQTAANSYVKAFLQAGLLTNLAPGLTEINSASALTPEKRLSSSRIDFHVAATSNSNSELWIEVKTPLIKLETPIPQSIPVQTEFGGKSPSARLPKQITDLKVELANGNRVALAGVFLYPLGSGVDSKQRMLSNLDLDGLLTSSRPTGLEGWEIQLEIDAEGVRLDSYRRIV